MKIKTPILFFSLILLIIISCKQKSATDAYDLIGNWVPVKYTDSLIVMEKSNELDPDKRGFTFKKNGAMIQRKSIEINDNEPVAYWDFDGSWELTDSLIQIKIDHWDGIMESTWKLDKLTANTIAFLKVKSEK